MLSHSAVSDSVTQQTEAHHAPLSMGFSRQESWSGLPFPPPVDLSNPGIKACVFCVSCIAARFFTPGDIVK